MTKPFRAILLIAVAIGSIGAAEPRQPTGRWVVDFAAARCVASRSYGTEQKPLFLVLKAPPVGNIIQLGVVRGGKYGEAKQLRAELSFDGQKPLRTTLLAFTVKDQKQRAYWITLPVAEFTPARTARMMAINAESEFAERFSLSAIGPLMKTMDECVADLRRVWNVDEANGGSSKLKLQVSGDLRGIFKPEDYPAVALMGNQSGSVALALLVDEAGKVADCSVVETSGVASLDSQSCALIQERARLKPAIGLDGKPAKGSFFQRITWRTL